MQIIEVRNQAELVKALQKYGDEARIQCVGDGYFSVEKSSHVEARESSHVEARESSHVEARESSHVVARESSHVVAWGSSHVEARGSSHVVAWESSHVVAGKFCAVTIQPAFSGRATGGVQIRVKLPKTAKVWCEFYGVKVVRGIVTLFKAVDDKFNSKHGMCYAPGTTPKAPDWDGGRAECGGGLHFSPSPLAAKMFDSSATRYVACPVKVSEIFLHPHPDYPEKVKAPRVCAAIWECDCYGNPIKASKSEGAAAA
jgi:hypothetical protein